MRQILAACVLISAFAATSRADMITFATPIGSSTSGAPLNGSVPFTTSTGQFSITLTDLLTLHRRRATDQGSQFYAKQWSRDRDNRSEFGSADYGEWKWAGYFWLHYPHWMGLEPQDERRLAIAGTFTSGLIPGPSEVSTTAVPAAVPTLVPEPTTLTSLATGLLFLGVVGMRKRCASVPK